RGGIGSGKSIIAATICGAMDRGIINVPIKALQEQYQEDYEGRRRIKLGEKTLGIQILKGRDNFICERHREKGYRCSRKSLVCTVPLDSETPRWKVAKECPHWAPIYPVKIRSLVDSMKGRLMEYPSVTGKQFIYFREEPCGYYAQNTTYADADVIVYNNAKWLADTAIGRKPAVDVEVFDEGDLFLDGLSTRTRITVGTITRLDKESQIVRGELIKNDMRQEAAELEENFEGVKSGFEELLGSTKGDEPQELMGAIEEYLEFLLEFLSALQTEYTDGLGMRLKNLLRYREDAYFFIEPGEITFFISDPAIVLHGLRERSAEKLLFMSATLQGPKVLEDIYNLGDFTYIEGEPRMQGRIYPMHTGSERQVNWRNWKKEEFRKRYWETLSKILARAKRPTLVQIHAYQYLPENDGHPLLPTQGYLRKMNQEESIAMFKLGKEELLFSTKTDRGIDLPDDGCRSIVLMKYPFPGIRDPFFMIMRKKLGKEAFWSYYQDLAWREFQQQIGRGLRN
ncbi:MAG: helicase C-terminal domain-containing protein, partial [Candidatus Hydrothermarchaeota archaeon]|nr:helicase C-terminal domain-containing protein [Candidatus Hydrothermarchaeota archaeon]